MRERPPAATGKEASLIGEVRDPAIFRYAVKGNDALQVRVLKKMFEDGFKEVWPSTDLHNLANRPRLSVLKIPANVVAAFVAKDDAAESSALLIAFHEFEEPAQ